MVQKDIGVEPKDHLAYKCRKRALDIIKGSEGDQYKRVWDYAATLKKYNLGSTVVVSVGEGPGEVEGEDIGEDGGVVAATQVPQPTTHFKRIYVCLQACKEGFVKGCRPLIGVDGCHLKSRATGVILTVVAKDGNSNIFPVAWVVVEVENTDSWSWFLELLVADLGSVVDGVTWLRENDDVTFMSDRQKGLLEAFKRVVPNAETRYCCRHIWTNFKATCPGESFKQCFWRAARAFTKDKYNAHMEGLKFLSVDAFKYLDKTGTHWCRHAFSGNVKSAMLLNNICESFNNVLRPARDQHLLILLKWIRKYVTRTFCAKREGVEKYEGKIMPNVVKTLDGCHSDSRGCILTQAGKDEFEVEHLGRSYIVNLGTRTYGCFKWNLTGIPCIHAFACILKKRLDPQDFVDEAYSKETYMKAYAPIVHSIPNISEWEVTAYDKPGPPPTRPKAGRPLSKKRRKEAEEIEEEKGKNQVKRKKKQNNCSKCGKLGHNKRSCKAAANEDGNSVEGGNERRSDGQPGEASTSQGRSTPTKMEASSTQPASSQQESQA